MEMRTPAKLNKGSFKLAVNMNKRHWSERFLLLLLWFVMAPLIADDTDRKAFLLDIDGAIGPATVDYLGRALDQAEEEGAELVILRMDTPGGLDSSMRTIIKRVIGSQVPVVTYVAPGGARAASAGTYILYASHVAAMAPGTNLGAATPVELGGLPETGKEPAKTPQETEGDKPETAPTDAKKAKLINDAAAYLRSLARLRGRNEVWAEQAVRDAASLSAEEALEQGVIDLIASDLSELQRKVNGINVTLPMGSRTLETAGLAVISIGPDWRNRLLSAISSPNVAYILMLLGIYGLIYEFSNPGAILPGTAGAVSLLLALYAFQVLPVNFAGVALILLGLALMAAEAFVPSFGALGIGGVVAFVLGSLILIDTDLPGYGVSIPLIVTLAVASALLVVAVIGMAIKSRGKPVVSGSEELIGAKGTVLEVGDGQVSVRVHGEVWTAHSDRPLHQGQNIRIEGRRGLLLVVAPLKEEAKS